MTSEWPEAILLVGMSLDENSKKKKKKICLIGFNNKKCHLTSQQV